MVTDIARNMALRDALALARRFGCSTLVAKGTGEIVVRAPDGQRTRVNLRRKDTPAKLITMLRRLERGDTSWHGKWIPPRA